MGVRYCGFLQEWNLYKFYLEKKKKFDNLFSLPVYISGTVHTFCESIVFAGIN